jgi:hypothetical protein
LLAEVSVDQFFRKRDTLEFHELSILVQAAIKRKTHLPGPRKNLGVLDRGFVTKDVPADRSVTFDNM